MMCAAAVEWVPDTLWATNLRMRIPVNHLQRALGLGCMTNPTNIKLRQEIGEQTKGGRNGLIGIFYLGVRSSLVFIFRRARQFSPSDIAFNINRGVKAWLLTTSRIIDRGELKTNIFLDSNINIISGIVCPISLT